MEIETVKLTDLKEVTMLVSDVSDIDVLPLLNPQGKKEYRERVLPDLTTTFDSDKFLSIKAVSDGKLVGFAALCDGNYLTHLFVSKLFQGSGVGGNLLSFLLKATEANEISLRSSVTAVSFYNRNGFIATGEEAEFNGIRFVPMTLVRT